MTKAHASQPHSPSAAKRRAGAAAPGADPTAANRPPSSGGNEGSLRGAALREALLDSRQRWRELVTLAADIAFETDSWGRFVFVAPDPALGWQAATLLGQTAELLLAETGGATAFNPFHPTEPVRRRRAWLKRPDGRAICISFATAPVVDAAGHIVGARGIGQDVTEHEERESEIAAALRRGEVVDHILWQMRKEVLAPRMMQAVLSSLAHATGSEGLAVLDVLGNGTEPSVLHTFGRNAPSVAPAVGAALESGGEDPVDCIASDGRLLLICPTQTRFGEEAALALWRQPDARNWDADERLLVSSVAAIIRVVLEHDAIQREMGRQARTDPLTGLLNRRAFMDELSRRFDRLEVDGLPGALVFVDLDNFKALNDSRGHDVGDEALQAAAQVLRMTVRPTDLVARFGGDEFALWLDGADELAAAERAEHLRTAGPQALAHFSPAGVPPITFSIGVAGRWPGRGEDADMLLQRADRAMYAVKRGGRGHWRVARAEEGQ
jgi:diguanylate cyclase (GGDEF)-like protein/PAS domain S-box-containing protein